MKTINIILTVFVVFNTYIFANDFTLYSDLKIGDEVNLIKSSSNTDDNNFYLYLFADANSCSLCISSVKEIYEEISSFHNLKVVLFMGGISNNNIVKIKKQYPSNWQIIPDEIFAYKSLYKVNQYPFYYILDRDGIILAMDKGGGELDIKNILRILKGAKNKGTNSSKNHYEELIKLDSNDDFIYANSRYLLYSTINENIYMFIPGAKVLLIYSNKGKLIETHKLPFENSISFYDPNWYEEPYSFMFVHNSYNNYREYLVYDIRSKMLTKLEIKLDTLNDTELLLHYRTYYSPKVNTIFTTHYTRKNLNLNKNFTPFIGMNISKNSLQSFGKLPEYYLQYKCSQFLYSTFLYDEHNKLLLTNINNDDNICFWNLENYTLSKQISLNNEKINIDIYNQDLISSDNSETKMNMFSKVNYCQNIYQLSTEVYALTLFKLNFIKNNINDYNYFYKIIIFNFEGVVIKVINLEKGIIPFFINDKFILSSKFENNLLSIFKYKLSIL